MTREQHAAEVQNLESMMAATQQMLGQHIAKYKDQVSSHLAFHFSDAWMSANFLKLSGNIIVTNT